MKANRIKRFVRSCGGAVFFAAYGAGSLFIGGLLFPPLVLFQAKRVMRYLVLLSWKAFIFGATKTGMIGVEISDEDKKLLRSLKGCVVVANHLTLIDVIVIAVFLKDATAIAKAAAGMNFFYSHIVKGVFLVNDDPMKVMDDAKKILGEGANLIVFPQGTRTPEGVSRPLRRGAAQIALHTGAPIIPVKLGCNPPVLAKGQPWYDLSDRRIVWSVKVGEKIPPAAVHSSATHSSGTHSSATHSSGTHSAAVVITETIRRLLSL